MKIKRNTAQECTYLFCFMPYALCISEKTGIQVCSFRIRILVFKHFFFTVYQHLAAIQGIIAMSS